MTFKTNYLYVIPERYTDAIYGSGWFPESGLKWSWDSWTREYLIEFNDLNGLLMGLKKLHVEDQWIDENLDSLKDESNWKRLDQKRGQ